MITSDLGQLRAAAPELNPEYVASIYELSNMNFATTMQQDSNGVNSHKSNYSTERGIEYTSERQVQHLVYNHATHCCKTS